MRLHLTLACIFAAANAIKLASSGCEPNCTPSIGDYDADTDHVVHSDLNIGDDVIEDVAPLGEQMMADSGVQEALEAVVGPDSAEDLVNSTLSPIVDSALGNNLVDLDALVEAEKTINPDEVFEVTQELPSTDEVVDAVVENFGEEHAGEEGIELTDGSAGLDFTPEQMENAKVSEIDNGAGGKLQVIMVPTGDVAEEVDETIATEGPKDPADINEEVTEEVVEGVA